MSTTELDQVTINGKTYIRSDMVQTAAKPGKRAVVVVDRGWIFAGDVEEKDSRVILTRAVWVFNWSSIGFDGVLTDPKNKNVNIRKLKHNVDLPKDAEVFRIPVDDNWGL